MAIYKIVVEGSFVQIQGDIEAKMYGFFLTAYIDASSANMVVHKLWPDVRRKIRSNKLLCTMHTSAWSPGTMAVIRDVWEMQVNFVPAQIDGMTLYKIGFFDRLRTIIKMIYVKNFKSWLFINFSDNVNRIV